MDSAVGPNSAMLHQLLAIRQDPQIRAFARRRAGDPELAEDALQDTYYAMARRGDRANTVTNLRSYFTRVLINQIARQREVQARALAYDFSDPSDDQALEPWIGSFERDLLGDMLTTEWVVALKASRSKFLRLIPGRSATPKAYKVAILNSAIRVLESAMEGSVGGQKDINGIIKLEYPEWFQGQGSSSNTEHQRLNRARRDVQEVLRSLITLDDLID
jgi:DNA-directed RNA polymerase specialized sigma24 family protein